MMNLLKSYRTTEDNTINLIVIIFVLLWKNMGKLLGIL